MNEAVIIFPHQLFKDHALCTQDKLIILIEHHRYFTDFSFHQKKLVLHRASMQYYFEGISKMYKNAVYLDCNKDLFRVLKKNNIKTIHFYDPVDTALEEELSAESKRAKIEMIIYESPAFLSPKEWLEKTLGKKKRYLMHSFYVAQRKRMNILLTKEGKPIGGKWTYDQENRKKFSADQPIPKLWKPRTNTYVTAAKRHIKKYFSKNPGDTASFFYPITHKDAEKWLDHFLKDRFALFGDYQDAMVPNESFLFHSILSPLINIGLLTPQYVVDTALSYAKKHDIPINSLEGFIRQIIGWREFVRGVYVYAGETQRTKNFFNHKRLIPYSFWYGETDIAPIDDVVHKVFDTAYAHHIERLMIMGNFMLLCEFDPDEIYEWFMELFIDAYDWVMVPNVYGMTQYADGGLMTTKPYISSSNYILKMSSYKKGEWCAVWDALYWHFIYTHKNVIAKNSRLKIMLSYLKRMKKETLENHLKIAEKYLLSLKN